jgi:hypothetical protein
MSAIAVQQYPGGINISSGGSELPDTVIFHGVEGVGKTSFAANAPGVIFGMSRGETGLLTLIKHGLVPPTPHFSVFSTWEKLLAGVKWLTEQPHDFKTFAIDTLNGCGLLCLKHVCDTKFRGEWTKFLAYAKGPDASQPEWIEFLGALEELKEKRAMQVIGLAHTKIKNFNNPLGDNYDRYTPDIHEKLWGLSFKWADVVLFGNFEQSARKEAEGQKAKGVGGQQRVFHTVRTAAWDAKNRVGLPQTIKMGQTGASAWAAFAAALKHEIPAPTIAKASVFGQKIQAQIDAGTAIPPQSATNGAGAPRPATTPPATVPYPTPPVPVTTPAAATPTPPPGSAPSTNREETPQRIAALTHLAELKKELFALVMPAATPEQIAFAWAAILKVRGENITSARELTNSQLSELTAKLAFKIQTTNTERRMAANAAAGVVAPADFPFDARAAATPAKPPVTAATGQP